MEEQSKTFIDARPSQEPINPVEKIRRPTDRLVVYVYSLFMLVWLVIGVAALCAHPNNKNAPQNELKFFLNAPFSRFSFFHSIVLVTSLILNIGLILLGIFLIKKFTKFFMYLGMGIYIIFIISAFFMLIFASTKDVFRYDTILRDCCGHNTPMPHAAVLLALISGIWLFFKAIFMIPSIISFFKVDKNEILNVVKDFCRVILGSPRMILFVGFITILGCLVFSFAINAIITNIDSDRHISHKMFDFLILIFGSAFALNYIYNFALMVISEYAVNYYWKNSDGPAVGQSISQIWKNHIGTIMLSSTPFVPFICAIVQAVKHTRSPKNKESYFFYLASKIFLVLSIDYFALITSSIYGNGFIKSAKKTLDTVLRRCMFYLATSGVIEAIIGMIVAIASIFMGIAFEIMRGAFVSSEQEVGRRSSRHTSETNVDLVIYMASFLYGFLIPFVTFMLLMYYSAKALLLNKIIIVNKKEQYNEEKTEVLNRL